MAALPTATRERIAQDLQDDGECPGAVSLAELLVAVGEVDDYLDGAETTRPQGSLVQALSPAYRNDTDVAQKRQLLARVASARAGFTLRRQRSR